MAVRVLGELMVIVVGVLIALWVDNANSERQARGLETAHLSGILFDLRQDSATLQSRLDVASRGLEVADRLMKLRESSTPTPPADSLAEWFFRAAFVDNFEVLDHTYREILGAGGLSALSDDELRRAVSGYYASIESAEFFTGWYQDEEADYWDLLAKRLDPADFAAVSQGPLVGTGLSVERLVRQLRTDSEIANAILMNRHWTQLRLEITKRRALSNQSLRSAIESELRLRGAL